MLAIFGRWNPIVMGRPSQMGRVSRMSAASLLRSIV
jgi:hypothetical protein